MTDGPPDDFLSPLPPSWAYNAARSTKTIIWLVTSMTATRSTSAANAGGVPAPGWYDLRRHHHIDASNPD